MPIRLTALILAPTLIAVILAGIRVADSVDSIAANQRAITAAEYAARLRALGRELGTERDRKAWVEGLDGVRNALRDGTRTVQQQQKELDEQKSVVDRSIAEVLRDLGHIDDSFGVRAKEEATQVAARLERVIDGHAAERDPDPSASVQYDYTATIAALLRLHDDLGEISDDAQVVSASRALSALAHAKEEASQQRAFLTAELLEPRQSFTPDDLQRFLGSWSRQNGYVTAFNAEADTQAFTAYYATRTTSAARDVEMTKAWAVALGSRNHPLRPVPGRVVTAQQWFRDNTAVLDGITTVEQGVAARVLDRARVLESAEQRSAIIAGALILALLMLVLATTVLIARSMVRPLRRLRAEALEIAGSRLPDMVRQMRESNESRQAPEPEAIAVGGRDEIGEVAQAFDAVHRQAVRLASEESQLRANVNAMFVNLSRRTQTLVERQISLIDGLERGEQDGTRLADLFKLDHLATRMRRNSENLLVLAGHEAARKRSRPARLVDVVRASLSEVEGYERVTVRVHRSAAVAGHAANDVVHLVAELVENAIAFSPNNTKVIVSSSPIEGGAVLLAVSDSGIGLTPDELVEINRRLAEPPTVDVSVSRRMGLFVVGRLSLRHGIRVQLRRGDVSGVIAMVLMPAELISNPDAKPAAPGYPETAAVEAPAWNAPTTGALPQRKPGTSAFAPPPRSGGHDSTDVFPAFTERSGGNSTGSFPAFTEPTGGNSTGSFPAFTESPGGNSTGSFPAFTEPSGGNSTGSFPAFTEHSGAFPVLGAPPASNVPAPPLERGDEYLPIFASVESAWFKRPDQQPPAVPAQPSQPAQTSQTGPQAVPKQESSWWSTADSGFQAAAAASEPAAGGVTASGLPRRTPKANLVPGSVSTGSQGSTAGAPRTQPPVSADAVRDRMSSFQKGVRRGRADLANPGTGPVTGGPVTEEESS
ncbi:sensor histidine kinase [Acrocarpospora catenulata]|uniref:sensor histidine kinase n=1 Tax=Acrocarpospora catenulata TaxID=2836182 RepID=UPI001BDB1AAD|nr:nitrate- and nitrite sensing domain-containing protein [Acrocarpospora catenulata]